MKLETIETLKAEAKVKFRSARQIKLQKYETGSEFTEQRPSRSPSTITAESALNTRKLECKVKRKKKSYVWRYYLGFYSIIILSIID